jgi:uncharacterized membrane protein YidH (DUF202 family)
MYHSVGSSTSPINEINENDDNKRRGTLGVVLCVSVLLIALSYFIVSYFIRWMHTGFYINQDFWTFFIGIIILIIVTVMVFLYYFTVMMPLWCADSNSIECQN